MNDTDGKNNNRVTVEIFGIRYPLKGVNDVESIKTAAAMVDERMRSLLKQNQYLPPDRIAMLTALDLADQLISLKKDYDEFWHILEEQKGTDRNKF
ncbi:cell division protein ZapA [Megamonas hypermegale]|uniref:cell division protein ZapA n=1 Tax=Megamonas hypermegale TaxID=158847 RepID=UPI0026F0923D|nr:cell division protein ZapA [Megamonas hypermegale]